MKGILIPAYVESIRTRKDRTMVLSVGTQEIDPQKAGELISLNGQLVTVYFSAKGIPDDDVEVIDDIEPEQVGRTPSQRLRAVLYLMWKNNPEGFKDKNLHYLHYMERIIDKLKTKLP